MQANYSFHEQTRDKIPSVSNKSTRIAMHVHGRKISNCALPPSHMEGLRLPTRIDSVRLRLHPFDYDFMHPSNYIKPSELRRKLSEL
jgi:hypothetical protein